MTLPFAAVFSIPEPSSPCNRETMVLSIFLSKDPGLRDLHLSEQYLTGLFCFLVAFFDS